MCGKLKLSSESLVFLLLLMLAVATESIGAWQSIRRESVVVPSNPLNRPSAVAGNARFLEDAPKHGPNGDAYDRHYLWLMKQIITNNIYSPEPCVRDGGL